MEAEDKPVELRRLGRKEFAELISARLRDKSTSTRDFQLLAAQFMELRGWRAPAKRGRKRGLSDINTRKPGRLNQEQVDSTPELHELVAELERRAKGAN